MGHRSWGSGCGRPGAVVLPATPSQTPHGCEFSFPRRVCEHSDVRYGPCIQKAPNKCWMDERQKQKPCLRLDLSVWTLARRERNNICASLPTGWGSSLGTSCLLICHERTRKEMNLVRRWEGFLPGPSCGSTRDGLSARPASQRSCWFFLRSCFPAELILKIHFSSQDHKRVSMFQNTVFFFFALKTNIVNLIASGICGRPSLCYF